MSPKESQNNNQPEEAKEKYYVYIIKCQDGSYYTGFTQDIERRPKVYFITKLLIPKKKRYIVKSS